jgi:hypothetical protein
MILYINGDSHAAAAEAVNPHAFAEDDGRLRYLGRLPHPDNLAVSWGRIVADTIKATFYCDAESAASNHRILRTTRQWLSNNEKEWYRTLVIIQWSTWEREEWLHNGTYYQVGSSGRDHVPPEIQEKYKNYVIGTDWKFKTHQAHNDIWELHLELEQKKIPHLFFNGNNHFESIAQAQRKEWGSLYISPYDSTQTYDQQLRTAGFDTVSPGSWHYGANAHRWWAQSLLKYAMTHHLI